MARETGLNTPSENPKEEKRKIRHRDWSGALFAVALGLGGLVLGRLGMLWIRFDVFSQFSVQFACLAAAGCVGLLVPRYKGLASAVLFAGAVAAYGAWPSLATSGPEGSLQSGEKRLRFVQFNVHAKAVAPAIGLATISALDPDVISLVEVMPADDALLDALKSQWPYRSSCGGPVHCEAIILSRAPLTTINAQFYWAGANYVQVKLGSEFGNLNVVALHTTRFPFAKSQFAQIKTMTNVLENMEPMVVLGDFNATPYSRIITTFASSLGLTRQTYLPTWPADWFTPQIAIDHIFTSSGIRALSRETAGAASGSDHLPIAVTLAIPVK